MTEKGIVIASVIFFAFLIFASLILSVNRKMKILHLSAPKRIKFVRFYQFTFNSEVWNLRLHEKLWVYSPIYYQLKTIPDLNQKEKRILTIYSIIFILGFLGFLIVPVQLSMFMANNT